jgi:hypothetical protein
MKYKEKKSRESDGEYTKYKSCVRIEVVRCPSIKCMSRLVVELELLCSQNGIQCIFFSLLTLASNNYKN